MKGAHLGEFEEFVLLAVHGLGEEAYGSAVQRLLERETDRSVSLGAVYAALDRLEAKGLLRSDEVAGTPTRGGRRRRQFRLTPQGARAIDTVRAIRERLYRTAPARPVRSRP
jgi:DNA-binding PadR family transcriptional regulator